jgi:hypothetical protein
MRWLSSRYLALIVGIPAQRGIAPIINPVSRFEATTVRKVQRIGMNNDEVIKGLGLTIGEMRAVAHRQFIGSIIVAILVAGVAALLALKPAYRDVAYVPSHRFTGAQQPMLVTPGRDIASMRYTPESP